MSDNMTSEAEATRTVGAVPGPRTGRTRRIAVKAAAAVVAVTLLALIIGSQTDDGGGGEDEAVPSSESAASDGGVAESNREVGRVSSAAGEPTEEADLALSDSVTFSTAGAQDVGGGSPGSTQLPLEDRAVVRTGSLSMTTDEVDAARQQVINVITTLGGYVGDEESVADEDGGLKRTDLRLMVPTDAFDEAMQRSATAGTVVGRTQSARDVTEQVVDVRTRVASAQASLRRIRLLLGQAVDLGDVIRLEQVLSSRQADLESLLAQQESLAAKTELATMQVTITVPPKEQPQAQQLVAEEETGFLAGLSRGWDALASGYVTLATVFGTALPTLVVLGLLALIARWTARRFRRSPASAGSAA